MNNNDIEKGMQRVIDDLTSYYLLGYYSSNRKLDGRFRSIKVRVKRPGVDVRARRGYRAATDKEIREGRGADDRRPGGGAAEPGAGGNLVAGRHPAGISLRTYVSWVAAPLEDAVPGAKSQVWVVGEMEAASAKSADWANGGEAQVSLTAEDGVKLADLTQPSPRLTRRERAAA